MDFTRIQVVGVLFCAVGSFVVYHALRMARKVREAQLWPSVKGRVVKSYVKRSGRKNRVYRAVLRYTYSVRGRQYKGRRYALGGELDTSSLARAEARCARYPEDSEPEVFFDPSNPKDSCLERVQEGKLFVIFMGVMFAGIGLAMLAGLLPSAFSH